MSPRVGLDIVEKRKNIALPGIEPGQYSPWPVAILTGISAPRNQELETYFLVKGLRCIAV
jgi:hypothetical protein